MARKDMTGAQFTDACKRRGFVPTGFGGYYRLGDTGTSVSVLNAGPTCREQLAYLIARHDLAAERKAKAWSPPEAAG